MATPDLEFLKTPRTYTTLIQDEKGELLHKIEPHEIVRPIGSMIFWKCDACQVEFSTKQSLERHKDRHPLCKAWKEGDEPILNESVYTWANEKIDEALSHETNSKQCKFCEVEFASVGNFHKHFKTSTVCNRLGIREIKKVFQSS